LNIFLTGGTGFIGSYFLKEACYRMHDIKALRRYGSQTIIPINNQPNWLDRNSIDEIIQRDLENIDVLVHFAATGVSPKIATWDELININIRSTIELMEKAHKASVKKIIMAGSFSEYGLTALEYQKIPPNASLKPVNKYAVSKAAAFLATQAFCIQNCIPFSYHRIFSAYGEGQNSANLWQAIKLASISGQNFYLSSAGSQVRDFLPVEEVAKAFWSSVEIQCGDSRYPLVTNIGTGNGTTVLEFVRHWWDVWGATGKIIINKNLNPNIDNTLNYVALIE